MARPGGIRVVSGNEEVAITDRDRADRQLGLHIALGLVIGAAVGGLAAALFAGEILWIGFGAFAGLIVATALSLGLGPDQV